MPPPLFSSYGRPVTLGCQIGIGGEGSVYEVTGDPSQVAKVYHQPLTPARAAKLRAMVARMSSDLSSVAAWPTATLSEHPGGAVVGLLMKRVQDHREIHTLYSPAHRKSLFPEADWSFLVHTARNCAAAFDTLHSQGVVVGDVNQSNVLVSPQGLVTLIDCDSFQIRADGQTYPCEVGVDLFTPPELQGLSFKGRERTQNHDRFGLAVLIFHLLFMGRHPFAGRYSGSGDMPIERAIKEFRFAYGRSTSSQMHPPLHALSLAAVSPRLAELFEKAFEQDGLSGRPSPREWSEALDNFQGTLQPCRVDPGHRTPSLVPHCVWCALIRQGAPNFFVSVAVCRAPHSAGASFSLASVWAKIEAVPRPRTHLPLLSALSSPRPNPWPANVPAALAARPPLPAILASPPARPDWRLSPLPRRKTVVRSSVTQRIVGYLALSVILFCGPAFVAGSIVGQLLAVKSSYLAWGFMALDGVVFALLGAWWLWLERDRQATQRRRNARYEEERARRQAELNQQRQAWETQLWQEQEAARHQYDEQVRQWEAITARTRGEALARRQRLISAEIAIQQAEQVAQTALVRLVGEFDRRKKELAALRSRHLAISSAYAAEERELLAHARDSQRKQFLLQHFISDNEIPDIGPNRKAILASFGVETAFDVEEIIVFGIPGFGRKLTDRLLKWRAEVEAEFRFDAAAGIPPHERRTLDAKYRPERQAVEAKLLRGEGELREIVQRVEAEMKRYQKQMEHLLAERNQAAADVSVIPSGI